MKLDKLRNPVVAQANASYVNNLSNIIFSTNSQCFLSLIYTQSSLTTSVLMPLKLDCHGTNLLKDA